MCWVCLVAFCVPIAAVGVAVWVLNAFDRVTSERAHERLGEHNTWLAGQFPIGSPNYKEFMAIARYHIHKAGYANGFTEQELLDVGFTESDLARKVRGGILRRPYRSAHVQPERAKARRSPFG